MKQIIPCKENRLVWKMLHYWEHIRGERRFPRFEDIDYDEIQDLWPFCFVLDAATDPKQPYFHYLGPSLAQYGGIFLSGEKTWTMTLLDQACANVNDIVKEQKPILSEDIVTIYDGTRLLYRSVLLPLSKDGEELDYLLGAANGILSTMEAAA